MVNRTKRTLALPVLRRERLQVAVVLGGARECRDPPAAGRLGLDLELLHAGLGAVAARAGRCHRERRDVDDLRQLDDDLARTVVVAALGAADRVGSPARPEVEVEQLLGTAAERTVVGRRELPDLAPPSIAAQSRITFPFSVRSPVTARPLTTTGSYPLPPNRARGTCGTARPRWRSCPAPSVVSARSEANPESSPGNDTCTPATGLPVTLSFTVPESVAQSRRRAIGRRREVLDRVHVAARRRREVPHARAGRRSSTARSRSHRRSSPGRPG